ncbi:MAG: MATE family efflux transporter [Salaquimonas sp.]
MSIISEESSGETIKPFEVSNRMVLALALPMTLAYVTTPLLGLIDTAVVGRLGNAALIGGLAVGAIIIDVIFTTFNFLRGGSTALTAQAVGREDEKEKQAVLFRAVLIGMLIGFVVIIIMPLILWLGLYFIAPSEAVADATSRYFSIRMLSAPLALANYAVLGWLIGLGRSGLALLVQVFLNGTNIILSILFGLYLGFGLEGVALGTILGEAVAFFLGAYICWRLLDPSVRPSWQRITDKAALVRFANLNGDMMLRSFVLLFAFAYFTSQSAGFGETTLAANAILMNFLMISAFFLDGLATAAEQIIGRAVGANYRPGFWKGVKLTTLWSFVIALFVSLTLWIFGEQLINLITTLQPVREVAYAYLAFAALTAVTGVLAFQMDGIFIGATWSREMSLMMVLSLVVYLIAWQFLKPYENVGLWLSLHIFLMIRGFSLSARLPVKARQTFKF